MSTTVVAVPKRPFAWCMNMNSNNTGTFLLDIRVRLEPGDHNRHHNDRSKVTHYLRSREPHPKSFCWERLCKSAHLQKERVQNRCEVLLLINSKLFFSNTIRSWDEIKNKKRRLNSHLELQMQDQQNPPPEHSRSKIHRKHLTKKALSVISSKTLPKVAEMRFGQKFQGVSKCWQRSTQNYVDPAILVSVWHAEAWSSDDQVIDPVCVDVCEQCASLEKKTRKQCTNVWTGRTFSLRCVRPEAWWLKRLTPRAESIRGM